MAIDTKTAGAASGLALAANPRRIYALICNLDSTEWAFANFGAAAEVNKGWAIPPGGNLPIDPSGVHEVWAKEAVYVIRGGTSDVTLSTAEQESS